MTTPSRTRFALLLAHLIALGGFSEAAMSTQDARQEKGSVSEAGDAEEEGPKAPKRTELAGKTRVPMIEGFRWVVVDVEINGKGPFRMILDTGAGVTVLNEDLVQELGLVSQGTRRIGDPSNPKANEVDKLTVESIRLGAATFNGVEAVGWRGSGLVTMGGIRGVLGFPTFAECLLTLDYPGAFVEVSRGNLPEPDGKEVLPMKLVSNPSIPIELAGIALEAHVDAGNSGSLVLPKALMERLSLVEGSLRKGAGRRASGPIEFTVAKLEGNVKVGSAIIESPEVHFDETLPVVNLGHEILSRFRVTFDQSAGRMRLAPPAEGQAVQAASPRARRIGVQMAMKNGSAFTVEMVVPGSAGEAAGIVAGDLLLEVDGKAMAQATLFAALKGTAPVTLTIERDGERKDITLFAKK